MKKSDFKFTFTSYGRYDVTYTNPKTGKKYSCNTTDMTIIDATKNEESPKLSDLTHLKKLCKLGQLVANSFK